MIPRLAALTRWSAAAVCGAGLLLTAAPARAEVDNQQWTLLTLNKELSQRWRAYLEIQPRIGEDVSHLERLLVRPAIGYRLNSKVSVWQGYGFTPLFEPEYQAEHRLFQQLSFEDKVKAGDFSNRTRLEERFIDGVGETAFRLRNMARFSHPVSADKRWALVGYDELFWNLNSTRLGPESGLDQNRLFLGVSREVNAAYRVETGYLLTHINTPRSSENRRLNVWVVQVAVKL